jgi:hydroxymethylglutaryl-CoA lyase
MNAPSTVWQGAGRRIHMQEVGTRDGLQMEQAFVPTEDKIALVNALSSRAVQDRGDFVHSPKAIPALKDAEIVMREITRRPGTVYTALVPNLRAAERAIESRTDELNLVMSVSETHNLATCACAQPVVRRAGAGGGPAQGAQWRSTCRCRACSAAPWRAMCRGRCVRLGAAFCRPGRARHHAVRHHGHGLPHQVHQLTVRRARWPGWVHPAFPQHARHGAGQCAGRH